MKQNVTISLDRELIQKAKVFAAQRRSSISRLLSCELEKLVSDAESYEAAQKKDYLQYVEEETDYFRLR